MKFKRTRKLLSKVWDWLKWYGGAIAAFATIALLVSLLIALFVDLHKRDTTNWCPDIQRQIDGMAVQFVDGVVVCEPCRGVGDTRRRCAVRGELVQFVCTANTCWIDH